MYSIHSIQSHGLLPKFLFTCMKTWRKTHRLARYFQDVWITEPQQSQQPIPLGGDQWEPNAHDLRKTGRRVDEKPGQEKMKKDCLFFSFISIYIYTYNIYISMFLDRMKNNCWRWSCPMGGQETSLVTHLIVTHLNNIVFVVYIFIALSPLFGGLQPTQSISVLHSPRFPKWLIFHWGTIKE